MRKWYCHWLNQNKTITLKCSKRLILKNMILSNERISIFIEIDYLFVISFWLCYQKKVLKLQAILKLLVWCQVWQYGLWGFQTEVQNQKGICLRINMGASEVFKNQSFKSQLFSSSQKKKYLKLKSWLNFNAVIVFHY